MTRKGRNITGNAYKEEKYAGESESGRQNAGGRITVGVVILFAGALWAIVELVMSILYFF